MKYKNTELLLDNFRQVLKDFSVDVQDVVRSAILDGVDISQYINVCKNNPLRLDQIRLGLKEGIDKIFFSITSGECIYKIRKLDSQLLNIVSSKMCKESLSGESLGKLIDWATAGYDLYDITISIIPKTLYEVFEQGFQKGFDMRIFNNGRNYTADYIRYCLVMISNGRDVTPFLNNGEGFWNVDCIKQLAVFSKIKSNDKWNNLIKNINIETKPDKVKALVSCVKNGIDITSLSDNNWTTDGIGYVIKAFESGLDYKSLISVGPDEDVLLSNLNQMSLNKSKRVSGRLRKK